MTSPTISRTPRKSLATILIYSCTAIATLANAVAGMAWFSHGALSETVLYFLAPALFATAAALVTRRSTIADSLAALASAVSLPWFYSSETRIWVMGNSWIFFNLPDRELAWQPLWPIILRILTVGALVFSLVVAVFRLLPEHWHIRNSQVRNLIWPAFAVSFAVLAIWFVEATTPYRMPGAVDYSDYPTFQILHLEKRGLHIHEKCLSLYQRRDGTRAYFSAEDRRLFQYRFDTSGTTIPTSQDLDLRVRAWTQSAGHVGWDLEARKPLRSWTAEGWYVSAANFGFQSYTTENGRVPPAEIPAIFHRFDQIPAASQRSGHLKDVCLGFCFDPPAAMGLLYSNNRCFFDGKTVKCR